MRIALGIEYNGCNYCGWQRQKNASSVQACLERAISKVANATTPIHAAGRTDTGVHATEQVVHFDALNQRPMQAWVMGVNSYLPNSVCVLWAKQVNDGFHARFSAQSRLYRYVIYNHAVRPALLDGLLSWQYAQLNLEKMQHAANHLIGKHDFSAYRAVACQAKSPIRTIHKLILQKHGEYILIDIHADGFLHHMVRNIAGVLMTIGKGEQDEDWSLEVLENRDRTLGGVTASPAGLYLVKVQYDEKYKLDSHIRWPGIGHV